MTKKLKGSPSKRAKAAAKPAYAPPGNDHLSAALADIVPDEYRGTDRFLDVVTWNIRFFHDRDAERVDRIVSILSLLNADLIVLQEILDKSLDVVAQKLTDAGAGAYQAAYGTTGGQQRVAFLQDLDWLRAKDEFNELFGKGAVVTGDGKDAFPRLPLLGVFSALPQEADRPPFEFQLLGVHLKSQRGGGEDQRFLAAERLAAWLEREAPKVDADVIVMGDWNQPPDAPAWAPFRALEAAGKAAFTEVNSKSDISHLMYRNKTEYGSRLDLAALSMAVVDTALAKPPAVVRWKSLDDLLASEPSAAALRQYIQDIGRSVSDHLPVVTRFYFTEPGA